MFTHASGPTLADRAIDDLNKAVDYWQRELAQLQADADWVTMVEARHSGFDWPIPRHVADGRAPFHFYRPKHRR